MREKSWDRRLEIYGYENSPHVALRIFEITKAQGAVPEIAQDTINAWKAKTEDSTITPKEQEIFKNAIQKYQDLEKMSQQDIIKHLSKPNPNQKQPKKSEELKEPKEPANAPETVTFKKPQKQ